MPAAGALLKRARRGELRAALRPARPTVEDVRVVATRRSPRRHPQSRRTRPETIRPRHRLGGLPAHLGLRKFSNVEAKVERPAPAASFVVFVGDRAAADPQRRVSRQPRDRHRPPQDVVDVKEFEAIDLFRIAVAKQAIEQLYARKNSVRARGGAAGHAFEHRRPRVQHCRRSDVTIRNIDFVGARSYTKTG